MTESIIRLPGCFPKFSVSYPDEGRTKEDNRAVAGGTGDDVGEP
jgi:hypothetical protein